MRYHNAEDGDTDRASRDGEAQGDYGGVVRGGSWDGNGDQQNFEKGGGLKVAARSQRCPCQDRSGFRSDEQLGLPENPPIMTASCQTAALTLRHHNGRVPVYSPTNGAARLIFGRSTAPMRMSFLTIAMPFVEPLSSSKLLPLLHGLHRSSDSHERVKYTAEHSDRDHMSETFW